MQTISQKEDRIHGSASKPFGYYPCIIPDHFSGVPMHWHSEFELSFIQEGSAEFICGDKRFLSAKGDIILTLPNVLHSIYPHENSRQVYDTLVFRSELLGISTAERSYLKCIQPLLNGSLSIETHITPKHHYYTKLRILVAHIFSCAKGDTPELDILLRSDLLQFLWLLETESVPNPHLGNDTDSTIRPALAYIAKNYTEPITIAQLAATVHLSQSYFMHLFQKYVGLRAMEYIAHVRINQACKLLLDTEKSISEIAYDCGFRNLSHFNRQFQKITGCSPTQYRKRERSGLFPQKNLP